MGQKINWEYFSDYFTSLYFFKSNYELQSQNLLKVADNFFENSADKNWKSENSSKVPDLNFTTEEFGSCF